MREPNSPMVSGCVKVALFCLRDCGIPVFSANLATVAAAASGEGSAVGWITALTRSESVTGSTLSGRAASGSIGEFKDISLLANVGRITMSRIHRGLRPAYFMRFARDCSHVSHGMQVSYGAHSKSPSERDATRRRRWERLNVTRLWLQTPLPWLPLQSWLRRLP